MIRTIKLFLTGFILAMAFTACEKEYSAENGDTSGTGGGGGSTTGTAVYTLAGAPGACSLPIINGIYTAGTALNASNTVILTVDVTTIGTYAITSGTANGITFSGAGSFTITGTQIVTLTGSGTPAVAGTFSYSQGPTGCSFPITVSGIVVGPVAVGTLDCASATLAGVYTQFIDLTSSNTVSIPVNVTIAGSYSISTTLTNGCTFSGSGNLLLGAQTIVLTGSGTPVNSGAILFPVSLGTSNCSFSITFLPGTAPVDFLKCSIDGGPITNFNTNLSGSLVPGDFGVSGQSATQDLQIGVTNTGGGAITVGTYHNLSLTNTTVFCVDQLSNLSGTPIWFDVDATGSSNIFTVNIATITPTTVTGTFNGKLTDITGTGGTKIITNGSFSITY